MSEGIKDKNDKTISVGDEVYTKMRGGKHQGEVGFQWFISFAKNLNFAVPRSGKYCGYLLG